MHHTFDETPNSPEFAPGKYASTSECVDSIYNTHLGKYDNSSHVKFEQHNLSQYRHRGYKIGSLMTEAGESEPYYKQPGHPLSPHADAGGRFQNLKNHVDAEHSKGPKPVKISKK
jgi:hypothetical protein